ncbi:POT family proton-dependent oligopeptide transporter [Kibdelosporangium banguiense]|uniref:POT family proton-dependent oligopeptide transporter n=1 Tax=Kibdelosporangium banguiense TaxID=1365924 RepID=A0ABS4TS80_9PSEU|nr:oligopeptide:H+ symporter [Kibdelosporangium banguiense]MBP2327253.1 POT family proton-dependent oligopeptide transporter [Kibdelosporangium banguiense]
MSTTERSSLRVSRWYMTLFFSDALERFGFYGLQAILVLYASAPAERGGLGLPIADAAALFGAWIGFMFMLSLAGGWIGDRLLGNRRALVAGCVVSVAGYLCMAVPAGWAAAVGLPLLGIGGAVYKPNHQAMINRMFGGSKGREAGISMMYVATQLSALLAPLVVGYLGERVSWNLAFGVAAAVLLLTAIQLVVTAGQFDGVGDRPIRPLTAAETHLVARRTGVVCAVLAVLLAGLAATGVLSATMAIAVVGVLSVVVPIVCYVLLYRDPALGVGDRRRLKTFLAVYLGATLFWMIIAHAASLLNLFARDHVDRHVFGLEIPASWLQGVTPLFILLLAPVIAVVLPRAGGAHRLGVKLGGGLVLVGSGFLVMSVATMLAEQGAKVSPFWLVVVYLTHACGEVIVAAVTISAAADVLPAGFMGRTLGTLWLFAGLGGGLGSGLVRLAEVMPEPVYYLGLGAVAAACGVVFVAGRGALARGLAADAPVERR